LTLEAVQAAREALKAVKPEGNEAEAPDAVYYGVEGQFTAISDCLADLTGLFEKQASDFGDEDVAS
jgi:hypothetical protein